jgi:hypothetical protein
MDFGSVTVAAVAVRTRNQALSLQEEAAEKSTMSYRAPELFDVPSTADGRGRGKGSTSVTSRPRWIVDLRWVCSTPLCAATPARLLLKFTTPPHPPTMLRARTRAHTRKPHQP